MPVAVVFDSEVWGDAHLLNGAYKRPDTLSQSVTVHLDSPAALQQLKDSLTSDPRLNVDVAREIDYYAKQSTRMTTPHHYPRRLCRRHHGHRRRFRRPQHHVFRCR